MASLELVLFGGFQARAAGRSVDVLGRKERALIAILALPLGELRSRDKLAGLLWSDRGDKQAHDSLKSAISRLKQAFGSLEPTPIVSDREYLALNRETVAVDVAAFERLLGEGTPECIAQATALYRGDLLDGLDVRDPAFEEWLLLERQRLRILVRDALGALLDQHLANGSRDSAAAVAHRLLALDPLREGAHRALMQVYAEQGQTTLALKQYQLCRDALQRELGVRPEAETERLYRSIQEKRATNRPTVGESKVTLPKTEAPPGASPRLELEAAVSAKPTIAVLPFTNMSGDPEQQYFSDGITEDIITELSRFRSLYVIARSSSFQYRGEAIDVKDVGREMGAKYVVEGSVRKAGSRIRISAQLIDATTGNHLWAERYDRDMQDLFAIQDDVVHTIVARLAGQVAAAGLEMARRKRTESLAAFDYLLRELEHLNRLGSEDLEPARLMFQRAVSIDPTFAQAYAALAITLVSIYWANAYEANLSESDLDRALEAATRAVALDSNDAMCHRALAHVHLCRRSFDLAEYHLDMATKANANDADLAGHHSWFDICAGRPDAALAWLDRAKRLNPHPPNWHWELRGLALYHMRRYGDAAAAFARMTTPPAFVDRFCAACYAQLGRSDEARAKAAEALRREPRFTLRRFARVEPYMSRADLDHVIEGMRKAGLPE